MLKIALLCGGPSKERNISLNSVRSVYDHIRKMPGLETQIVFSGEDHKKYIIDEQFLYSNTTSDFKFMLRTGAENINDVDFLTFLRKKDLVFPVMHGKYGEDGKLQKFLETNNIPHIASSSKACGIMYNKKTADAEILCANNMVTIPKLFLDDEEDLSAKIKFFFDKYSLDEVILKPVEGGSSFGVTKGTGCNDTVEKAKNLIGEYHSIVVEKLCQGREFTIIILEHNGMPVALIPTEIEILDKEGAPVFGEIFDRRKKYMSTTETHYYCPARFDQKIITEIRSKAEFLFSFVGANDFLRIDGWVLEDGSIYFSDFNPVSGMEQNSFIFQQAAKMGLSHGDLLEYILRNACTRYGLRFDPPVADNTEKKRINILLGGDTSERQVSVLSGTNTWLKLLNSKKYYPVPYLLAYEENSPYIYEIPYSLALNHTTEEIYDQILNPGWTGFTTALKEEIITKLEAENIARCRQIETKKIPLEDFLLLTKKQMADIFICLHGGFGENGSLQKLLEQHKIHFNGSGSTVSELCMDKYLTGEKINALKIPNLRSCKKKKMNIDGIKKIVLSVESEWKTLCEYFYGVDKKHEVSEDYVIVKPNRDGCSTGIVILRSPEDLKTYCELCISGAAFIPEDTFADQPNKIQLSKENNDFLFEEYIKTIKLEIQDNDIIKLSISDWVELTVGVLEKQGVYHALNPSVTVADNSVLSVEEKFQGGTGINLTPPPEHIIGNELGKLIKADMETVAKTCGIEDYCRIDIFANNKTNEIIVIEINSLPGLSPSTVLFQQGAKETPPLYPVELLEFIIEPGITL